jgi:hypothetical protein
MKTKLFDQHGEHIEWINRLAFYNDEIRIMQNRIEEIIRKNTSKEIAMEVEHFQNQLLIQAHNIRDLRHRILSAETRVRESILTNPVASDHRQAEDHKEERELFDAFEKNFHNLWQKFKTFSAKRL